MPSKTCGSCHQTTHDIDKQAEPSDQQYLQWNKGHMCQEIEYPAGIECLRAGVVGESILVIGPMADVLEQAKNQSVEDQLWEGRGSTVKGTDTYQRNCEVDVMKLTTKESTFGEEFETGSSQAVWAFARQRRLKFNYPDDEDLLAHTPRISIPTTPCR